MSIDLTQFNNPTDFREYCRQPMRMRDGRVVATDGVSIMSPDQYDGDASTLMAAPANIEGSLDRALVELPSRPREWHPLSGLTLPQPENCTVCQGKGYVVTDDCPDCDGDGEFQHGSHLYECKECDGEGNTHQEGCAADNPEGKKCWSCRGRGYGQTFVAIPGMPPRLGADLRLLSRFPADGEYSVPPSDSEPIVLRGAGWRGVLMPMRG